MSIGYGGYADIQCSDDTLVVYLYCCYNANNDNYRYFKEIEDGEFYIDRDVFAEPEIHEKIKKTASGKKLEVKRIKRDVSIKKLLEVGKIKVKNASGTWQTTDAGNDIMAIKILFKMFDEYQKTGRLPEHINWFN